MPTTQVTPQTGAEALLLALKAVGVEYLFANAGTDFPPVIEALSRLPADHVPTPVTIPHETAAVGMAHGYWLITGSAQALMVHVNVGLANTVMGVINAMSDNVPLMVLSGRTPLTETGRKGGRVTPIQYGQEMSDQTSLVRNTVKFDYELRYPEQGCSLVRRAAAIALSAPCGPVYLSLPREPLTETLPEGFAPAPPQAPASAPSPDPEGLKQLADWITQAKAPLILCQRGDPQGQLSRALSDLARHLGLAVCEPFTVRNVLASDDPALVGYDPAPALAEADLVIVLDSGVPWIAALSPPQPGAKVVHIGPDPLFARMPVRGYRSDLTLTADPTLALNALRAALPDPVAPHPKLTALAQARREALDRGPAQPPKDAPITPAWLSRCVSDMLDPDAVVFNELGLVPGVMRLQGPNRLFTNPHSGGLGWAFPAALGAQLADRDRLVVAAMGDGSYIFANPVACHQIAEALQLPLLIILKNGMWNAVRRSVIKGYPDGAAVKRNEVPLTSLSPLPDFTAVAGASRAHAERVTQAADLPAALARAINVIRNERRHALLDVTVAATDVF